MTKLRGQPGNHEGQFMQVSRCFPRSLGLIAALMLSACANSGNLDWDLRNNASSTKDAAGTAARPTPDQNGVISYPTYQVVVARKGDSVTTVAQRVGIDAGQLAKFNALQPNDSLNAGEVLALPTRVAAATTGAISTAPGAGVDVTAIATTALDRVDSSSATTATPAAPLPFATTGSGPVPVRYQVKRGETAFSIARTFNISAKSLADWNGLGPDLAVREGQYLIIPTPTDAARLPPAADGSAPGAGSVTPEPPSASTALPNQPTPTVAQVAKPPAPVADLSASRTASSAARFAMPADGKIIRAYQKKVNEGIDIAAATGSAVKAAADGIVAAITHDPNGTPILVLKHDGGLLTVYAGVDGVTVAQGAVVKRGQTIATVKSGSPSFLHFEVRQGLDSVDPLPYLQ